MNKAVEWYKSMEGYPYGFHNFIFGWLDTPDKNLPSVLDVDFTLFVFSFLENIIKDGIDSLIGEGLNKRLGTTKLSIAELAVEMVNRNITFGELLSVVERDEWIYSDGPSMVCSAFVAGIYQSGGLLRNIEATE